MIILEKLSKYKVRCQCEQCGSEYIVHKYDAAKSSVGHLCNACKKALTGMKEVTQSELLKLLHYDPVSGLVTFKTDSFSGKTGDIAGYPHNEGYYSIAIGRKEYLLHRIIWFMQTGEWPDQIDHINHIRSDNHWCNLRQVESRTNQLNTSKSKNNTSGYTGVRILPSGKYNAYIMVNRKQIGLGTYTEINDAIQARKDAEILYGFHANHGM